MIVKGNQRAGGGKLAAHLSNPTDNDHVELHELRGFASSDLAGAFMEIEIAAKGTKCEQPFFAVSLNPPPGYPATIDQFDMAADAIEAKYPALADQPRAVVFHEKEGRRHCHVVWSRIDGAAMKAIPLPFTRERLREVSRDMFAHMGIDAPAGMQDRAKADPLNYDLATCHQAKRMTEAPADFKTIIQQAWQRSDNRASFEQALGQHGLMLAQGDRRGFVAVHHSGEALSLTRYAGVKAKEAAARIGPPDRLPTVDQARQLMRERVTAGATSGLDHLKREQAREMRPWRDRAATMKQAHQVERQALKATHEARQQREDMTRANRLRTGVMGLWDRLSGRRGRVSEQNAREAQAGRGRDRDERQSVIDRQQRERGQLQGQIVQMRRTHRDERQAQRAELAIMLGTARDRTTGQGQAAQMQPAAPEKRPVLAGKAFAAAGAEKAEGRRECKPRQPRQAKDAAKASTEGENRPVETANDFRQGSSTNEPEATAGQGGPIPEAKSPAPEDDYNARFAARVAEIEAEQAAKTKDKAHDRGRGMRR